MRSPEEGPNRGATSGGSGHIASGQWRESHVSRRDKPEAASEPNLQRNVQVSVLNPGEIQDASNNGPPASQ